MKKNFQSQRGTLLIPIMIFSAIAIIVIGGIVRWAEITIRANRDMFVREEAIQLAESGVEYYRWHLAHAREDFKDGTGSPGPYVHNVYDKDGNLSGQFSLDITPPPVGSTKVVVKSTGIPEGSTVSRTIKVEMAIPSFAKYAVAVNDVVRFGEGTEVFGQMHSNKGIRFDGLTHNIITSAVASYNDTDYDDCNNSNSFGVHTCVSPRDPSPPAAVPNRPEIFEVGRQFPVPELDFTGITSDLAAIKSGAMDGGKYFGPSSKQGYQIILKTNDTFDVYRVNSQSSVTNSCRNNSNSQPGWNSWSINNKQFVGNYAIPENGLIFVEDNVWVEGQINSARVTIAAGKLPDIGTRPQITVNNNLNYTNYDGTDVIALISQGNLNVGLNSQNDLEIDAALVSQNGRVGRYNYDRDCGANYVRNSITLLGTIITNIRYGFAYTDGTGYQERHLNYDANLLYSPPPSFPLTSDYYSILSWQEI